MIDFRLRMMRARELLVAAKLVLNEEAVLYWQAGISGVFIAASETGYMVERAIARMDHHMSELTEERIEKIETFVRELEGKKTSE